MNEVINSLENKQIDISSVLNSISNINFPKNLKRLALAIALALVISKPEDLNAQGLTCVTPTSGNVNIRSGNNTSSDIIGSLPFGSHLQLIGENNGWNQVPEGWVSGGHTRQTECPPTIEAAPQPVTEAIPVPNGAVQLPFVNYNGLLIFGNLPRGLTHNQVYRIYDVIRQYTVPVNDYNCSENPHIIVFGTYEQMRTLAWASPENYAGLFGPVRFDGTYLLPAAQSEGNRVQCYLHRDNPQYYTMAFIRIDEQNTSINYIMGHEISHLYRADHANTRDRQALNLEVLDAINNGRAYGNAYYIGELTQSAGSRNGCAGQYNNAFCEALRRVILNEP